MLVICSFLFAFILNFLQQTKCISINYGTSLDETIKGLEDTGGEINLQDEGPYELSAIHSFKGGKFAIYGSATKNSRVIVYSSGQIIMETSSVLTIKKILLSFSESANSEEVSAFINSKGQQNIQIEQTNISGTLKRKSFIKAEDSANLTILDLNIVSLLFSSENWNQPLISLLCGLSNINSLSFENTTIENGPIFLLQNSDCSLPSGTVSEFNVTYSTLNSVTHTFAKAYETTSCFLITVIENVKIKFENCYFLSNNLGTGLVFIKNSRSNFSLSNCLFKENKAQYLFYANNISALTIKGVNNKLIKATKEITSSLILKLSGSFIMVDGYQSISIEESVFQDSELFENSFINLINSLVPKTSPINVTIKNTRFNNMKSLFINNASLIGTFLHIRSTEAISLSIIDCYFSYGRLNNSVIANSFGGPAIFVSNSRAITNISGCTFMYNVANLGASCIQYQGEVFNLERSNFYRNGEINFLLLKSYGPVAADAFLLKVNSTDFIETKDEIQCGVTLMRSQIFMAHQYIIINNSNFLNSYCDRNYDGGVIYFDSKIFLVNFILENTKIKGCDTFIGTMFLKTKYRVEISFNNVLFYNLTCYRGGCAISYDFKEGMIIWTSVNFTLMKGDGPTSGGGATICYFDELNTKSSGILIYNSIYKDLSVNTYGGAYYIIGGWYFVKNTTFINCYAPWGGVLATTYNIAEYEDCIFYRNIGTELASTILLRDKVDLRIENCIFNENYSPKGATISVESSVLLMRNSSFINNRGVHPAIIELSLTTEISVVDSISVYYTKNTTYLFTLFSAQLEIRNSSFFGNSANLLKATDSDVLFKNCKVRDSVCFEKGCVANLEKSNFTFQDSDLYEMKSSNLINSFYLVESNLILKKIILIDLISTITQAIDVCDAEGSYILMLQSVISGLHDHGLMLKYSFINITACTFYNPIENQDILLLLYSTDTNITLIDNLVYNFNGSASDHSTFTIILNEWNYAYVIGNYFENILNKDYGLLSFENGNVTVIDNRFNRNKAEKGSCLYFSCLFYSNLSLCNALVKLNFFLNNKGEDLFNEFVSKVLKSIFPT